MPFRMTVLCENSVQPQMGLIGEHGFACLVETPEGNYLFDTGQGAGILRNSRILGKDLSGLKGIVLSHGHYDHTGGLPDVLHQTGPIAVFGHPDLFRERFRSTGKLRHYIGLPYRRSYLESLGASFRLEKGFTEIGPGLFSSGEIPRLTSFERGDDRMTAVGAKGEEIHPDPLTDDLSLAVDTPRGLVVLLGCAHAGLVNILAHFLNRTGRDRIYAVLGGTHLGFAGEEQFEATLQALDEYGIEKLGAAHCTGLEKAARLHARFGERFFFGAVGNVLEV